MLSLGFGLHIFTQNQEMREITLGQRTRHYFTHFPVLWQKMLKNKFRNEAQKKVLESPGLVGAYPGLTSDLSTAWLLKAATAADFN